jgi:uncharacterized protein (TIGR03032 family)
MGQETRDIRCSHSDGFPSLLERLRCSLLISTYQTGHLVVVSTRDDRLVVSFHQFERAMGIAVKPGTIAVCTRREVWFLRNVPDVAAKLQPTGVYDACFLARTTHFTGDIEAHEAAWVGNEFWVVNTLFSCLAALHPHYSFAPRWRPGFVSELKAEDRCHLNGMAVVDGKPRYVTALGETNSAHGWREGKQRGGCLIEVPSGNVVVRGLALPHSPRVEGDRVFFLHSGRGTLEFADGKTGEVTVVASLPGVVRGLAIFGGFAFVGLSKARPTLDGVPIVNHRDQLKCGVLAVDLRSGQIADHLEFATGVEEIFDVQVLPGVVSPFVSGPEGERESGKGFWTVAPG